MRISVGADVSSNEWIKFFKATLLTLFLALFATIFLNTPSAISLLVILIFILSSSIPSQYPLQRIAISSTLVIGLSPIYLLTRGFITDSSLNRADLFIYIFTVVILRWFLLYLNRNKSKSGQKSIPFRKGPLEYIPGCFGLIFGFFLQWHLFGKSFGNGVAWISSGDSKNHLLAGADLVRYGDLLPSTFLTQPINLPSTLSLLLSQIGSDLSSNPSTLNLQMQTYAFFWVVLFGFMGVAFSATYQVLSQTAKGKYSAIILVILSLIPFTSLILGPALNDGFFTAIFGITTVTVLTNWYLELNEKFKKSNLDLAIGFLIFASTLMSWMFITAVTLPIFIAGVREATRKFFKSDYFYDLALISLAIFGVGILYLTDFGQNFMQLIKTVLSAKGAITTTSPSFYIATILSILLLAIVFKRDTNKQKSFFVIPSLHLVGLIGFKLFSDLGLFSWNYYLLKYQWVMFSSLFGFFIALIFFIFNMKLNLSCKEKLLAISLNVFLLVTMSEAITPDPVDKSILKVLNGWENPRASIMDVALTQKLNYKNPTLFFHYGYAGDARLANFWMNAILDPQDPVRGWNYTMDTSGDPKQLCDVNAYYPTVKVVTSDMKLEHELSELCPGEVFDIKLIPSAF